MTFPGKHPRLFNTAPVKYGWDTMALAKLMLCGDVQEGDGAITFAQRIDCLRYYFTMNGVRRLHIVPSRSGTLWAQIGLALAIDLAQGGDGEYEVENDLFWPRDGLKYRLLDWRAACGREGERGARSAGPDFGTQIFHLSRYPYFRIRGWRLQTMRTVVVSRNILASLESAFFKAAATPTHQTVEAENLDSFDWDSHLDYFIEFFNSWGDMMGRHPAIRHYRYEDLKADPVATHKEMLDFWGLDVPEECLAEGFRRATKKENMKRMSEQERNRNYNVSTREGGQRDVITGTLRKRLVERLNRELTTDFGYEFTYDARYGVNYN